MCYSKEVQLITALVILISALAYYLYFSNKFKESKWRKQFLKISMIGVACIGLHQFFEFLSLTTENRLVYKIGLIISVCAVYFLLRSLEILSNKKIHSKLALIPIALVSIQILISDMNFTEASFYLKHNSAFFWAAVWMFLFIYWHICAFKAYSEVKDDYSKKTVLIYLLAIADISFILSAIYVLFGYFFLGLNVCTDAPSIWCTFYAIEALLIPFLMFRMGEKFKRTNKNRRLEIKQTIIYLMLSLLILILFFLIPPMFRCLTWKFVFP